MSGQGATAVEDAVKAFSELDRELDQLEAEVRSWGRALMESSRRSAADARKRLLDSVAAEGEEMVSAAEGEANEKARAFLEGERSKLQELERLMEGRKDELVQEVVEMLMPEGEG